ncbi:PREDICTED: topless-related [Prunus dulcis]|uniref:PREDICTED: topless-related n=1 Tax=Prunus dulcis TaxID=3755 RepID=A0A5E4FA33_PRUDU|nr:hypothetical protein L3X38_008040 [Prunus dulcis]VVA23889.1 PREDICTED: topless-related [Prunus dulcis]
MAGTHRDYILSIIQFLEGANLHESARRVERESGLFFNLNYFEDCFIRGAFQKAEEYVSSFTTVNDNHCSTRIIHEIRWHKFLEAMDNKRYDDAKSILEEFKDFERYNPNIIAQMTELFDLEKFRSFEGLPGDPELERRAAWEHIKKYLKANQRLAGKLRYQVGSPNFRGFLPVIPPTQAAQSSASAGSGPQGNGNLRMINGNLPCCCPRNRRV